MPRKKQAIHASGLVEVKATVGKDINGKRIQKSFYGSSKLEAKKKADEYILRQEVASRTGEIFIKKDYTFAEWANKWLEVYKKPNVNEGTYLFTYETTVRKHLIPYLGKAKLTEIRNIDIQSFLASNSKYSQSMLKKMRMCLLGIFDAAIENDLCYKNPAKKVVITSQAETHCKQVYTSEQIERVKHISYSKMNEVIILLSTGLRRGELLGLRAEDIDINEKVLYVKRSVSDSKENKVKINPPKWNSYRTIPLYSNVIELLVSVMPKKGYIFLNENDSIYSPNSWSRKLKRFMDKLPDDIPRLTAHELRHTFGTDLRRQGVDIYTIQKVMGHKDIKMTSELYVHNEVEELKKAMKI